jgi:hypothetical protein
MSEPGRRIFRASALEAYRRRTEKDIVPRIVPRPVIACLWLFLAMLLGAALLAWSVRIPTYVRAPGVVRGDRAAVIFIGVDDSARVRPGRPVSGRIGSSDTYMRGAVADVPTGTVGPDAVRERYGAQGAADLITQPAVPVTVRLADALPAQSYAGSRVAAQVEVGSQRLLGLLPGIGRVFGGAS